MGEDAAVLERSYCPPRQWQPCSAGKLQFGHGDSLLYLCGYLYGLPDRNGAPESHSNHFAAAACPTLVEARVGNENRKIVAAAIAAGRCTGWTTRHVVSAHDPSVSHIIQNAKPAPCSDLR